MDIPQHPVHKTWFLGTQLGLCAYNPINVAISCHTT